MDDRPMETINPLLVDEVLADLSPEGAQERRLARYAAAKARQGLVSKYIIQRNEGSEKPSLEVELKGLQECGSFLVFRHYFTLGLFKLIQGCTCKKHLLCALCAIRRAAKCIAIYSEKISQVMAEAEAELEEVMITFTIKNGEDLKERFDHLLDSMKRLLEKRRNCLKNEKKTHTELKHVSGAVYSYEVTYTQEKGFHPHCHMIALIPKGIFHFTSMKIKGKDAEVPLALKEGLIADWYQITGDSFIIDVRRIIQKEMPKPGESITGTRLEALVEVFKYALKMNQISKDSESGSKDNVRIQVEAYEVLKGRRLVGSFGSLWGVKIPDNLNDSPLTDAEIPFVDLVYQYSGITFGYQLTTHGEVQTAQKMPSSHHQKSVINKIIKNKGESKWAKKVHDYLILKGTENESTQI